jgi:hypothetical protein
VTGECDGLFFGHQLIFSSFDFIPTVVCVSRKEEVDHHPEKEKEIKEIKEKH